jgi:hypothetical protein
LQIGNLKGDALQRVPGVPQIVNAKQAVIRRDGLKHPAEYGMATLPWSGSHRL